MTLWGANSFPCADICLVLHLSKRLFYARDRGFKLTCGGGTGERETDPLFGLFQGIAAGEEDVAWFDAAAAAGGAAAGGDSQAVQDDEEGLGGDTGEADVDVGVENCALGYGGNCSETSQLLLEAVFEAS